MSNSWKVDVVYVDGEKETPSTRSFETEARAKTYFEDLKKMWIGECKAAFYHGRVSPEYGCRPVAPPYHEDSND